MRHAALALAALLAVPAAPARAASTVLGSQDFNIIVGYKLWANNWLSWIDGTATNPRFESVSMSGIANNVNTTVRYKRVFTNLGYMATSEYEFPRYRNAAGTYIDSRAKRAEVDWNLGFMAVPQLGFTVGVKSVEQKWRTRSNAVAGAGTFGPTLKYNWTGPTAGIVGSGAIGKGFSIYGNGAGGIMNVTLDGSDIGSAGYESAELGLAWKAQSVPFSGSFGYKFQRISTKLDRSGFAEMRGNDVTSGYVLGLNLVF